MFKDYPHLKHLLTAFLMWGCSYFFFHTSSRFYVFIDTVNALALAPFIYGIWLYYKEIFKKYYQQMKKKTEE